MSPASASLLERRRRVLMPCLGLMQPQEPLHLVRGAGTRIWDVAGREYLDFFSGVSVNSLGHCHPEVVDAIARQLGTLQHTTTLYLSEPVVALAEQLVARAPAGITRVFFCADGSGAVEGALIAARIATGRPNFVALDRGLHGRTSLALDTTGLSFWRHDPFPPGNTHAIETPMDAESAERSLVQLRGLFASSASRHIAAMIVEPVVGNGGIVPLPAGYLQEAAAILRRHGALLICDEVQTGFCRTGEWFGIGHAEIVPDLMACAKALGNGYPIGAWLATEEVAQRMTRPAASTFGGNLPAMAGALRVLEIMARDGLAERARRLGARLLKSLEAVLAGHPNVGGVRGRGLMVGVEIKGATSADAAACDGILQHLREFGVLAGKTGPERNVLTFLPPLIVTEEEVDRVTAATGEACARIAGGVRC